MAGSKRPKVKRPKAPIPTSDPVQSARFLETAKNLGVDESGKSFEGAIRLLVRTSSTEVKSSRQSNSKKRRSG